MTGQKMPLRADGRLWYVLNLNPVPWTPGEVAYAGKEGGGRRTFMRPSKDLKTYQRAIADEMSKWVTIELPTDVDVLFVYVRSLDEIIRGGARNARVHQADATNMQKATEDALQGILFGNDNQNRVVKSVVYEQAPDLEPYVAIGIKMVSDDDVRSQIPDLIRGEFEKVL